MIEVLLSPWTETPRIWKEGKNVRSLYVASVEKNTRAGFIWCGRAGHTARYCTGKDTENPRGPPRGPGSGERTI